VHVPNATTAVGLLKRTSWSPWEKFNRATFMPLSISAISMSLSQQEGPRVHTICTGARGEKGMVCRPGGGGAPARVRVRGRCVWACFVRAPTTRRVVPTGGEGPTHTPVNTHPTFALRGRWGLLQNLIQPVGPMESARGDGGGGEGMSGWEEGLVGWGQQQPPEGAQTVALLPVALPPRASRT
jgi:hypothetical protein